MLLELMQASRIILPAVIPYNMFLRKKKFVFKYVILLGFSTAKNTIFFVIFSHEKYLGLCELLLLADKTWEIGNWTEADGESRGGSFVLMETPASAMPRDLRTASQTCCFCSRTRAAVASLSPWQCFLVFGSCGWGDWCWQAYLNKRFIAVWSWFGSAGAHSGVGARPAQPSPRTHGASPAGLVLLGVVHGNRVAVRAECRKCCTSLNVSLWACHCPFQWVSENNKGNAECVAYFMCFILCLAVYGQSCSAPISFMDSRAAGWVGRGRREDAAGDDGISLFDLVWFLLLSLNCGCGIIWFIELKSLIECCFCLRNLEGLDGGKSPPTPVLWKRIQSVAEKMCLNA